MKVKYNSFDKRFQAEFEADNQKELFEQLARFQEVFEVGCCGKCKSARVNHRVRVVEDNKYFELACLDCGHTFGFGQNKKGNTLFPKGEWTKWTPENK